jgi:anti-sigma B factor antagonist
VSLLARVLEEHHGEIALAAVDGEVDSSNAEEIAERLRSALTNRSTALIVDLSPTRYLDSAGINVLFQLSVSLRERQQGMLLVVPPDAPIARAIALTGLDAAVPTHPDARSALGAAEGIG